MGVVVVLSICARAVVNGKYIFPPLRTPTEDDGLSMYRIDEMAEEFPDVKFYGTDIGGIQCF